MEPFVLEARGDVYKILKIHTCKYLSTDASQRLVFAGIWAALFPPLSHPASTVPDNACPPPPRLPAGPAGSLHSALRIGLVSLRRFVYPRANKISTRRVRSRDSPWQFVVWPTRDLPFLGRLKMIVIPA